MWETRSRPFFLSRPGIGLWRDHMRKLNVDRYRKILEQERDRIRNEIDVVETRIGIGDTGPALSELADYDNHPGDMGTETFEKEKDLALRDNFRSMIGRIDEAIGKIDRGTYGECDRCGREISMGRLDAVPWAIYCVECQDIIEGR